MQATIADTDFDFDVTIVGLGPTGAVLANYLGAAGLKVLVLEREADIFPLPRALHFDGECMRVFQALGMAAEIEPQTMISPGMKFINSEGKLLLDWPRPKEIGPQGWNIGYRFHQPDLESVLRRKLQAYANVDVRLRHDMFALTPLMAKDGSESGAELRVENMRTGQLYKVRSRYVVGCDGARSLVRRVMASDLTDLKSHERWLVLDVILKRERPDLGDHSIQYCNPSRPATYVRGPGARRRWEIMLMPGDDPKTINAPENIWPLLAPWITPDDAVIERPAIYTFHSVVAKGWRRGPLMIAGDAAHQTPPFMGQGLCAGVRDASNLAWKLELVCKGLARETLLDTYESERSPHVTEFIQTAVRFGGIIQATDPEVVRARDAEMARNPQTFRTPDPALGAGLHEGPEPCGKISRQPILSDGRKLDDLIGFRFGLVARPGVIPTDEAKKQPWLSVLESTDPAVATWLDGMNAVAVLLRPDRYVAGIASNPSGVTALFRQLSRVCT